MKKLLAEVGEMNWSGRSYRIAKEVMAPYALSGGAVALAYQLLMDFLRPHHGNNERPLLFDHAIATTVIFTIGGFLYQGHPRHALVGAILSVFLATPMTWWL